MDCVRQRIATSENVEPVTRTACVAWRRTPSSAAAATYEAEPRPVWKSKFYGAFDATPAR